MPAEVMIQMVCPPIETPPQTKRRLVLGLAAGLGGGLAIAAMEWLSTAFNYPLAIIPFATSIVLVIAMPDVAPAQPRALIGGHLLSTLIGLIMVKLTGPQPWAAAIAVGLAILVMVLSDTLHPPAGIDPLLVVSANLSWHFILAPVLLGALLLTAFAFVWHRVVNRRPWPVRWI